MGTARPKAPVVEGWFTLDAAAPHLIGSRCRRCETIYFPKESFACRNPGCGAQELEDVPLSRRGKLWSYTNNCYAPPAPYVAPEPFVPYAIAAVELEKERIVVLGQVVPEVGVEALRVGMEMELVLGTLCEEPEREVVVWKWRPAAPAAA